MSQQPDYAIYDRIYQVAEQVPRGMVTTYGDVAAIVGGGCDARTVGQALNEMPPERAGVLPWQRVINREGGISTRGPLQRELLEAEGVEFDARGHVIMARFRWEGPSAEWTKENRFHTLPPREEGEQLSLF
jgi:methylated-DNA-protein-cysteine methyltransferase related protein